jgi:phage gp36-like protein
LKQFLPQELKILTETLKDFKMAGFIKDEDYSALIRDEIKDMLLQDDKYMELLEAEQENYAQTKKLTAEGMAISQIKNYLFGRYDVDEIFTPYEDTDTVDPRNKHIVMITIDCTLYHLYTSLAPNKIPEHRKNRYGDALSWLKDVSRGNIMANLPKKKDDNGNDLFGFSITSEYSNEDNRW